MQIITPETLEAVGSALTNLPVGESVYITASDFKKLTGDDPYQLRRRRTALMIRPTLKRIIACKASELVRFTDQNGTHWALVGQRGNELLMLLVFQAEGLPSCVNVMRPTDILQSPFQNTPVLSYGIDYSIRIDHAGDCEVGGAGALINVPGAYVMTAQDDEYVCGADTRMQGRAGYFDLKTGHVRSEPGNERAVLARWELVLNDEPPIGLLQVQAKRQQVNA